MQTPVPRLDRLFSRFRRVEVVVAITDSPSVSAAFHLAALPLTKAGRLPKGLSHSRAGSTDNRFLTSYLIPPCRKTPYFCPDGL